VATVEREVDRVIPSRRLFGRVFASACASGWLARQEAGGDFSSGSPTRQRGKNWLAVSLAHASGYHAALRELYCLRAAGLPVKKLVAIFLLEARRVSEGRIG
jgi:hypothetical protein